jgi:dihydrofolate synthase/folylpolyglutamate synthase
MPSRGHESPIRTLEQAAAWLEGLINVEKRPELSYARFSLAPIRALLERLGRPERDLHVLHIAGSKGKGSSALLAESVLLAAGRRTGTFTSPHLESWTERFRIGGRPVDAGRLAEVVDRVRPHVDALRAQGRGIGPTFFDATTAVALLLFREAGVDDALLEVGLGGRLDSTNAVVPAVTCITSIELEHTDRLGGTLAAIAAEKAGILKPGVPVVVGDLPSEAQSVVEVRAAELGAPLVRLGKEFHVEPLEESLEGVRFRVVDGPFVAELQLPVPGKHQSSNAALALACTRRLLAGVVDDAALAACARAGLAGVSLPGRVEVLAHSPWIVVDAAHTAASARALAEVLQRIGRPVHLVLSISSGKDTAAILDALLPCAGALTLTRVEPARSLTPAEIAAAARVRAPELPQRVIPNPHLALRAAREALGPEDVLCVTGSIYLAGIARSILREAVPLERSAAAPGGRGPRAEI